MLFYSLQDKVDNLPSSNFCSSKPGAKIVKLLLFVSHAFKAFSTRQAFFGQACMAFDPTWAQYY
jgi:hypothetical protein